MEGPHLLLHYAYVENMLERRVPHREAHLAHARAWKEDGRILAGGATGDPPSGALFVFQADADPDAFAEADPYVRAGLVTEHRVERWNVVI